jgi:dephospho-CoA kinase
MTRRLRIGLTGGIASGKSTVAARFLELGVPVIDADESARHVVAPGTPGLARVLETFGGHLLTSSGTLDRGALRRLVFADPTKRRDLESILHPLIRADMELAVERSPGAYVVMAIPLLVEGGARDRIDRILVVDVPEDLQIARVMARDGGTADEARAILAAQAPRESRLRAADDVLVNAGSVGDLRHAVDGLHDSYLRLAAGLAQNKE